MIKIGTMIGDRYEVLERIGMGGMSDVYKAKDHKLNRHVAVKVLKQEFLFTFLCTFYTVLSEVTQCCLHWSVKAV